jgi:hypothetical protein
MARTLISWNSWHCSKAGTACRFCINIAESQSDKDDKDGILTFSDTITGCLPVWKAIDGTQFQAFFS